MKRYIKLKIAPLFIILILSQRLLLAGDTYQRTNDSYLSDTIGKKAPKSDSKDSLTIDSSLTRKVSAKNILCFINGVDTSNRIISWRFNPIYFDLEVAKGVDTSIYFPHLFIPTQKRLETLTSLGNLGAPLQADHFFNRGRGYDFLFSRFYGVYMLNTAEQKHFYLRRPLTLISYTSGGGSSIGEQSIRATHSQNVNKYLNFGLTYDNYGTKGIYKNQKTKDNFFSLFASYYKDRFSVQGAISYSRIRNNENGGLEQDSSMNDATIEPSLISFQLKGASSEIRKKSVSGVVGYTLINRWVGELDKKGNKIMVKKPVFTLKAIFDANKQTRTYSDTSKLFYENYYISKGSTHDSAMILLYQSTILAEFEQLAKLPGLPGVRFWITNTSGRYYYFKPTDFLFKREDDKISTNHVGVGIFSYSPYLSYSGSLRMYLNGYRAADKELLGQMVISPWKTEDYPYIKAKVEISDREPDLFSKNYFSNHFKWDNDFAKEKWFMLGGSIGADKWRFEAGYNLVRINDFVYFDTKGLPSQTSGVTITSAFVQKEFKLGRFYSTNRVVWQAYDNKEAISLPNFTFFSSLYFEYELVKKVLTARIGANVFFRTKFYADAFSPATGQFYNQKTKKIGDYPIVDAFADFKWKRAVIFLKFDHINQGIPNNEYFSALHHPLNRRIFKFGVSWIFYD